jgi:polysaccharide biosynthesis transport protein
MLQVPNKDPPVAYRETPLTALSPSDLLAAVVGLARRRSGIILLIFGTVVVCGVIYLLVAAPKYMAQAEIMIDTRKQQLFQQQSVIGEEPVDSALDALRGGRGRRRLSYRRGAVTRAATGV